MPEGTYKDVLEEPGYNPAWEASQKLTAEKSELQEKAYFDQLTGLLNNNGLNEVIDHKLASAPAESGRAVLLIDLSGLKYINDTFGHHIGNEYIQWPVSHIFPPQPKAKDNQQRSPRDYYNVQIVFGRRGGDEYGVIAEGTREEIEAYTLKLQGELSYFDVTTSEGKTFKGSAAVGGAFWKAGKTREDLFKEADRRMLAIKKSTGISRDQPPAKIEEEERQWIFVDRPEDPTSGNAPGGAGLPPETPPQ